MDTAVGTIVPALRLLRCFGVGCAQRPAMELPRVPRPRAGRDALADNITRQGYTFQTLLGTMGLNHMNGRVQDAISGRFISPDPFVTEAGNTQNWNRYAYVYNNPLTYVDPSGFEQRCWQQQATVSFQNAPNEVTAVGITIDICAELPDIPAPNYSVIGGEHPQGDTGHGGDGGGNAGGKTQAEQPELKCNRELDFDQFANQIEENRFDLKATLGTLFAAEAVGTMPKTPGELRGLGVPRTELNPMTSQLSRWSSRFGVRALREIGRTTAGVAIGTAATAGVVFEGFYDWTVIGKAAWDATSSKCSP